MNDTYDFDVAIAGGGHKAHGLRRTIGKSRVEGFCSGKKLQCRWRHHDAGSHIARVQGTDLFGSSHVWIHANPWFKKLEPELAQYGLKYIYADDHITGHPNKVGPGIIVYKDINKT